MLVSVQSISRFMALFLPSQHSSMASKFKRQVEEYFRNLQQSPLLLLEQVD